MAYLSLHVNFVALFCHFLITFKVRVTNLGERYFLVRILQQVVIFLADWVQQGDFAAFFEPLDGSGVGAPNGITHSLDIH